jgi:hypothetical protein
MNTMHLIGTEEVARAASRMQEAAQRMNDAAARIEHAFYARQQWEEEYLTRLEALRAGEEPAQKEPLSRGEPSR